jgi:hypothetical protein
MAAEPLISTRTGGWMATVDIDGWLSRVVVNS